MNRVCIITRTRKATHIPHSSSRHPLHAPTLPRSPSSVHFPTILQSLVDRTPKPDPPQVTFWFRTVLYCTMHSTVHRAKLGWNGTATTQSKLAWLSQSTLHHRLLCHNLLPPEPGHNGELSHSGLVLPPTLPAHRAKCERL